MARADVVGRVEVNRAGRPERKVRDAEVLRQRDGPVEGAGPAGAPDQQAVVHLVEEPHRAVTRDLEGGWSVGWLAATAAATLRRL